MNCCKKKDQILNVQNTAQEPKIHVIRLKSQKQKEVAFDFGLQAQ